MTWTTPENIADTVRLAREMVAGADKLGIIGPKSYRVVLALAEENERLREAWSGSEARDLRQSLESARTDNARLRSIEGVNNIEVMSLREENAALKAEVTRLTYRESYLLTWANGFRDDVKRHLKARDEYRTLVESILHNYPLPPEAVEGTIARLREIKEGK